MSGNAKMSRVDRLVTIGDRVVNFEETLLCITDVDFGPALIAAVEKEFGKFRDKKQVATYIKAFFEDGIESGWLVDEVWEQ